MAPRTISGEASTTQRSPTLEFALQGIGGVLEGADLELEKSTQEVGAGEARDFRRHLLRDSPHLVELGRGRETQFRSVAARVASEGRQRRVGYLDLDGVRHEGYG